MAIVIKKRVGLDFLGDDYKESYLTFSVISLNEYEELLPQIESIGEDNTKSVEFIKTTLTKHFVEGKFDGADVKAEELFDFDLATLTQCFQSLTGSLPKD